MAELNCIGQSDYDVIILGGGSAGIVSGVMAGGLGLRVLLIEKYQMGGECLNTGCVPSKALLHAANVAQLLRKDAELVNLPVRPLSLGETSPVLDWVRSSIGLVRDADATEKLLTDNGVTIRRGSAHFLDAHTVQLMSGAAEERITADYFLLATGSSPVVPDDIPGLAETAFLTNQTVFDLHEIPERLLVLGAGPIGVEMAQAFGRLGSKVTLVQKGERLLPRDDSELVELLTNRLRTEGIEIRLSTKAERITENREAILQAAEGTKEIVPFDQILVSTGRKPNIDDLGLNAAGVEVGEKGITVNNYLQTTVSNIYACGDVIEDGYQFSHIAEYQAKIAIRNIAFPGSEKTDYHAAPWATFTDPELAHVGLTEDEAKQRGIACEIYRQPFAQNDRAITDTTGSGPDAGMVKILVEPGLGGKVLGAQILGPRAGELLQEWIYVMDQGGTIRTIADMVHVYPSLTLASQHAAQQWYKRQAQRPVIRGALDTYVKKVRPHEKALAYGVLGVAVGIVGAALLHLFHQKEKNNG